MARQIGTYSSTVNSKLYSNSSSFSWEIQDFSSCSREYISPQFECCDSTWNLSMYPKEEKNSSEFVSLFLKLERSEYQTCPVKCQISIKNKNGVDYVSKNARFEFVTFEKFGWTYFFERQKLFENKDQLLPDDILTVSCIMISELRPEFRLENIYIPQRRFINLKYFFSQKKSDVIINVRGEEIPARKSVLTARSLVFSKMFEHNMRERRKNIVEIVDFDPERFREFLCYLYHGTVDILNEDNVYELYELSDKYDINDLIIECLKFIRRVLTVKNVCDVFRFAEKYRDIELDSIANTFLANYVTEVLTSDEWKSFSEENTLRANTILKKMILNNAVKINL